MTTLAFYQLYVNYKIICKSWKVNSMDHLSSCRHVPQPALLVEHNGAKVNQKKTKKRKKNSNTATTTTRTTIITMKCNTGIRNIYL